VGPCLRVVKAGAEAAGAAAARGEAEGEDFGRAEGEGSGYGESFLKADSLEAKALLGKKYE
jgi:hypothetical protein